MKNLKELIQEANAKFEARKEEVLNSTYEMKPFNGGAKYQIKVLSIDDKGFCKCVEVGAETERAIRVSINWVEKGKKV